MTPKTSTSIPTGTLILAILAIVRGWLMPLRSGFWLDETGTYYLIEGTWQQFLDRMSLTIQSPAYCAFAWLNFHTVGHSEYVLRLPSIFAMALAAWFVYRLAAEIAGAELAQLAALTFIALPDIAQLAFQARPYSMLLAAATGSMLYFYRWLHHGGFGNAAAWAALLGLEFYFHPASCMMGLVYGAVILWEAIVERLPIRWAEAAAAFGISVLLAAPILPYYYGAARQASNYSYTEAPNLLHIADNLPISVPLAILLLAVFAASLVSRRLETQPFPLDYRTTVLLLTWMIVPAMGLLLISKFTPARLFVPRYYSVAVPSVAILIAALASVLKNPRQRQAVVSVMILALVAKTWSSRVWPVKDHDWRLTAVTLREERYDPATPVFLRTGFIEASLPQRLTGTGYRNFILSPNYAYPMPGQLHLLPYLPADTFEPYMAGVTADLATRQVFYTVGEGWEQWFGYHFGSQFKAEEILNAPGVPILRYRRVDSAR